MKNLVLALFLLMSFVSTALAAPSTITFQNFSAAGQTNYTATCSIAGVLDNTDKINDSTDRINLASLRVISMSKAGMGNYSTALHTRGSQFRVSCVRTASGADHPVKMYFDRVSTYWMQVINGIFKFY